ncbi:NUDIX hydrolase [Parerythrobacter aestuarii]|uniref:NUDIX hydrolase n=1 Tax=Parerythrobacter aestuarii TaxID=3020909 RepID=UPI0024DE9CC0|nr:NUDIX hydrolase [Parerythrobacter aestuarii]
MDPDANLPEEIMWQGKFVTAKRRGRWEYAGRARGIRAAAIIAIDDEGHVILVEQYRVPLGKMCLEIPAGLIGDHEGEEDEDATSAAIRELEEETGYRAERMEVLGEFYSSPGMVSEAFTLLRAHGLIKVGEGGGTESEDITVHRVKFSDLPQFVAEWRKRGHGVDVRIAMLMAPQFLGEI